MKKSYLPVLIIIFAATFLSACLPGSQNQNNQEAEAPNQEQSQQEIMNEWQQVGNAVANGESVMCQIRNIETDEVGDYYMQGEKIKYQFEHPTDPQQSGSFISDGEYIYSWNTENKQGMKFKIDVQEETQQQMENMQQPENDVPDFTDESTWKEYENTGYTIDCEVSDIADSEFVPPADITFTDFSEMMMNALNNAGTDFNPEQYQQMMQ